MASRNETDKRTRRCPRLGHPVSFEYCRRQADESLCPRILDCWWEAFDVEAHLREQGYGAQVDGLRERVAPPKVATLVDLIEKAKRNRR